MTAQLAPTRIYKSWKNDGTPNANGTMATYRSSSTTPQATYTDSTQTTQNTNPIIFNARGEAAVWLDPTLVYKFVEYDSNGGLIAGGVTDNINGSLSPISSIIPAVDNAYTLGSPASAWAQLYLGANHEPALDTTSQIIGYYPKSVAEGTASVTPTSYGYPPLNVLRYGADPTGISDSGTAFASAISVLGTAGGTIIIPAGTYLFASQINVDSKFCIIFKGDGGAVTGGHNEATILKYTGTATSFISARSAFNIVFRDLQINWTSSSFTGYAIDFSHVTSSDGSYHIVENCQINSFTGLLTNGNGINFDKCINSVVTKCNFDGANNHITGQNAAGNTYSNTIRIEYSRFANSFDLPILGAGNVWTIIGNTFEPRSSGGAGACFNSALTPSLGFTYIGNYHADATAGSGTWVSMFGSGHKYAGNFFVGPTSSPAGSGIKLNSVDGYDISGNYFEKLSTAIVFGASTLTLTGGPSGGATSATLNASFTGNTEFYAYTFSNGDVRYVKLTNGATTATWTTALTSSATATITANTLNGGDFGNTFVNCTNRYGSLSSQISFNNVAQGFMLLQDGMMKMWGSASVTAGTPVAVTFLTNNGRTFASTPFGFQISIRDPATVTNTCYGSSLSVTGVTLNVNGTGATPVYWEVTGIPNLAN